jgi:hypothetical protein
MGEILRHRASRRGLFGVVLIVVVGGALAFAPGAAADTAFSTRTPISFSDTNPCTLEPFAGTGFLHMTVSSNLSTSGMVTSHTEANLESLQAVTMTGAKYVVPAETSETVGFDSTDLMPFHETVELDEQFIRLGEDGTFVLGDDFYEHIIAHVTVNANSVITVNNFTVQARCK